MADDLALNILIKAKNQGATSAINNVATKAILAQQRIAQATIKTAIAQERLWAQELKTAMAGEKLAMTQREAAVSMRSEEEASAGAAEGGNGFASALGGIASGFMTVLPYLIQGVKYLVGFGVASTKMAGDFQQAMLSNVAHAGLAKSQFDNVSQSVLKMSTEVGRSPTKLAEALYPILSGFSNIQNQSAKSALALSTLKLSFQAVAGTTVDGTAVANAAVGTFNALGLATNNAATNAKRMTSLMDVMDLTVQQGNMTWDAYKNVISKLAVSIQGTSVKFNEASASLATLTNEGFSAQKAQTYLSNLYTTMAIKTDALAKHAKALKVSFNEQKYASMTLADKIAYLNEVTGGNRQKILALLGGNATALKAFNALSTGVAGYKSNLEALNHAHGALKASFDTASQGFNFSMSKIKAALDVVMITIGTKFLPVVTQIANVVSPIIGKFADWLTQSGALDRGMNMLAEGGQFLSGLIKDIWKDIQPLVTGIGKWVVQNNIAGKSVAAMRLYMQGFGAAIRFVVPILVQIAQKAGIFAQELYVRLLPIVTKIVTWFRTYWPMLAQIVSGVWTMIQGNFQAAWALISGVIKIALDILGGNWKQAWVDLQDTVKGVMAGIGTMIQGALQVWGGLVTGILIKMGIMKSGIDQQTDAAKKQAELHALQMKDRYLKHVEDMQMKAVQHTRLMIDEVMRELARAKTPAEKHAAEMKLRVLEHTLRMQTTAVKHTDDMRKGIEDRWKSLQKSATSIWGNVVTGIQNVVGNAVTWLKNEWATTINVVVGWFSWLYNHNYYFKNLVDSIVKLTKGCIAWIQGAWKNTVAWITDKWNQLAGFAKSAWAKVSGVFSGIWNNYIAGPLGRLWNRFTGWFGNLANIAIAWGSNLIAGFINGIKSQLGAVGSAVSSIASKVAGFLGFHSPAKEGPGREAHLWGPNLIKMFANDIQSSSPRARAAAERMMSQLASAMKGYPDLISKAHMSGNKAQESSLKQQLAMLRTQMTEYKGLVKEMGFAYDQYNPNNPINFSPHHGKRGRKGSPGGGYGTLYNPGGSSSGGGVSSSGGGASSGGTTINNYYSITLNPTIEVPRGTPKEQAQHIYDELDKLMARKQRFQNIGANQVLGAAA